MGKYLFIVVVLVIVLTHPAEARETVVKHITNNVISVTPGKKQLHTLGWPNDIINSIAVKTKAGNIIIDTQNSPANAKLVKEAIIREFKDTTFVYVINTHGHSCHSGGNCVFNNSNIIAHENSIGEIKDYDDLFLGQTVEFLRKKIYHRTNVLDTITKEGALSDSLNEAIDLYRFYEDDLINNYRVRYPDLTFENEKTIEVGNTTIWLKYMGKGHGDADIAVYIKEEKVLCIGNIFHLGSYAVEEMPSFYLNRPNEINQWISSFNKILSEGNDIKYIITTHGKRPLDRKDLVFVNEYCKAVREKVLEAKEKNLSLESVQEIDWARPVFQKYAGFFINSDVERMHKRNMSIIWRYVE